MKWSKLGLVFRPDISIPWQASHAALPTCLALGGSLFRIFFSSRDKENRAHIGSFDIDLLNPMHIVDSTRHPVLSPGEWGYFDDHGVQASCISRAENGDLYLYYLGWNTCKKDPLFYSSIGLAISKDGGETFVKYSQAPIMQRSRFDPWMVSGGTVIRKEKEWLMYYLSGFKFEFTSPKPISWYDIKIARSKDGIEWARQGEVALELQQNETNISRMTINKSEDGYEAWFPVKNKAEGYRCGYAVSSDCINWVRVKGKGKELLVSKTGWDSEAIDKMEVIPYKNQIFMFYNGNRFGFDGIGLAVADV